MFVGASDFLQSADKWLCVYILHFVSIHITRAICIEETNSLGKILSSNMFLKRLSFFISLH